MGGVGETLKENESGNAKISSLKRFNHCGRRHQGGCRGEIQEEAFDKKSMLGRVKCNERRAIKYSEN